jgi:hypothetical protein
MQVQEKSCGFDNEYTSVMGYIVLGYISEINSLVRNQKKTLLGQNDDIELDFIGGTGCTPGEQMKIYLGRMTNNLLW